MVWFMCGAVSGGVAWVWLWCFVGTQFPFIGAGLPWWHTPLNLSTFMLLMPCVFGGGWGLDKLALNRGWRKPESFEKGAA